MFSLLFYLRITIELDYTIILQFHVKFQKNVVLNKKKI